MNSKERWSRAVIYLKTLSVLLAYILLTWTIHQLFMGKHISDVQLSVALSFTLLQVVAISSLLSVSFVVKTVRHRRELRSTRFNPLIREKLALHLTGSDQMLALRRIRRRHGRELEHCLVELMACMAGPASERLAALAVELGLVRIWLKRSRSHSARTRRAAVSRLGLVGGLGIRPTLLRALGDRDDLVKVEAARALIRFGEDGALAEVFHMALSQDLLVRVILIEALRPYAPVLSTGVVPRTLASSDVSRVLIALQMIEAWGRSMPLPECVRLFAHSDARVRMAVLRLIPQSAMAVECEQYVWRALEDTDAGVREAAAEVCGKSRLSSATLMLKKCLRSEHRAEALASAYALAHLGSHGCRILESEVVSSGSFSAAAALEALERVKLNRLVMAGI